MGDNEDQEETVGKVRFPCMPSLIALQQMRNRLHSATGGRRLMKWSALATGRELRRISKELCLIYDSFTEDVRNAFILIARCRYFYPNVNMMVVESGARKACVTVGRSTKNVAGCKMATYDIEDNCPDSYPCLGIDRGGEIIYETKRVWHELLRRMIQIQQLRSNFISLDVSHKNATKKQNVLGKIIIPRTQVTIRYILSELEELEREEFFRLKKVLEVKYRHKKKNKGKEPCPECVKDDETEKEKQPPPSPPEVPPIEDEEFCILCEGPMQPEKKRKLTEQQKKQESAAFAKLRENLGKVLDATAEYEKTATEKESVKEFKETTERLRKKLREPPESIPDNINTEKLCVACKDMFNEQLARSNCIVCSDPIVVNDSKLMAAAKENKSKLQQQLETILAVIKDYERDGLQDDKLKQYKNTAVELKNKLEPPIPKNVDVNKLCSSCKERMASQPAEPASKVPSKSKVSIKEPSATSVKRVASVASNTPSTGQNSLDMTLGIFETEEITEIIQVRNPDGTFSEKRRIITIKRTPRVDSSHSGMSSFKDRKNVGHVVVHHRRLMERLPRDVHSEYAITSLPMADRMVKTCISSNLSFNFEEVLKSITELAPRPALETSHSSQTAAGGTENVKSLVSTGSTPFGNLEEDDDEDFKTPEENLPEDEGSKTTEENLPEDEGSKTTEENS